ncbi:hypothetical protein [Spirosoma aerophilum]
MKLRRNQLIWIWLISQLLVVGCKQEDVTLLRDIAGDWQISQITFRKELSNGYGSDSTVQYQKAIIHFAKNDKSGEGWYSFDGQEKVPFFFYARPKPENNLFINVGTKAGPGLHPSISLNGEAPFLERSNNKLILDFEAGFRNNIGLTNAQTHKARAVLVR